MCQGQLHCSRGTLLTSHCTRSSKRSSHTNTRCCNTGRVMLQEAETRAGPPWHRVTSASLPAPSYNPAEKRLCSRAACTCTPSPRAPTAPITPREPGAAPLSTARPNPRVPSASSLSPSVALPVRHALCLEGRKNACFVVWGLRSTHGHQSGAETRALLSQKAHPWLGLPGILLAPSTGISVLAALGLRHRTAPNSLSAQSEMQLLAIFFLLSCANLEIFPQICLPSALQIATFGICRKSVIYQLQPQNPALAPRCLNRPRCTSWITTTRPSLHSTAIPNQEHLDTPLGTSPSTQPAPIPSTAELPPPQQWESTKGKLNENPPQAEKCKVSTQSPPPALAPQPASPCTTQTSLLPCSHPAHSTHHPHAPRVFHLGDTFFFALFPPFEVSDTEQIARGRGLIQEKVPACLGPVKIAFLLKAPRKEFWDGAGRAAGHRHAGTAQHPKIIPMEFHLHREAVGKLTGAGYKRSLEAAFWRIGDPRMVTQAGR